MPPGERSASTPWPLWPLQMRVESSHEEGGKREWAVATTHFESDENGNVKKLHAIRVGPAPKFAPIKGSEFTLDAELVLLAMGFSGPSRPGPSSKLRHDASRRAAISKPTTTRRRFLEYSQRVIHVAVNLWWCGLSRKGVRQLLR